MELFDYIKESNPKIVELFEKEYNNYMNFKNNKNFLKVGHTYFSEVTKIRYIIYKIIPFLDVNSKIDKPNLLYCFIPIDEEYYPNSNLEKFNWKTEEDLYKLVLKDVTSSVKRPNQKRIKSMWEFYWNEEHTKIFKVNTRKWSYDDSYYKDGKYHNFTRFFCKTNVQVLGVSDDKSTITSKGTYTLIRLAANNDCWCVDRYLNYPNGLGGKFIGHFDKAGACKEVFGVDSLSKLDKVFSKNIKLKSVFEPYPYSNIKIEK